VLGEKGQHVVEERDAGGDLRSAMAVDRELDENVGFTGDAVDLGVTCFAHFLSGV
jgi:hypothetical protein